MSNNEGFSTNRYTVAFATTALTTNPTNIFPILSGDTHIVVNRIDIGVISTSNTNFGLRVYRGSTTPVSTASVVTPVPVGSWSGHADADCTVSSPTTNIPSTASAKLLYAYASDEFGMSVDGDFMLSPQQRLDVIMATPPVATVYGTLSFSVRGNRGY